MAAESTIKEEDEGSEDWDPKAEDTAEARASGEPASEPSPAPAKAPDYVCANSGLERIVF